MPYEFFDVLLNMCQGYPTVVARDQENQIIGFGMLRPYSPFPTFSQTAEITYFLKHGFTRQGIGRKILEHLTSKGREKGISSVLASISSLNEESINFHLKNGFSECGRFRDVGRKRGKTFDVVYFQRMF
jgi:phosphinothricin acetyltransferase